MRLRGLFLFFAGQSFFPLVVSYTFINNKKILFTLCFSQLEVVDAQRAGHEFQGAIFSKFMSQLRNLLTIAQK